ncbi:MAG: LysM peptidoglycan-binding domain-containing protein [Verrucomicrobiales bacterium]|jgi:nucleoid-associated protein YgaU|nr:LysM peptidoglycan-binding domain-containing protein [Verrucomicrobiales bacterium]
MIKLSPGLFALSLMVIACGGGKYERSEISASAGVAPDVEPSPATMPFPAASGIASSSSKPVIYDYPGGTQQIGATPAATVSGGAGTTSPALSTSATSGRTYTVRHGDTLWRIANNHGVSVSDLQRANGLSDSIIKPGQVLRIP